MKRLFLLVSAVLLVSLISACSSRDNASPDVTPPTVVSVTPLDGASNVDISSAISVTFSEAMDTASAQDAFIISGNVTGTFKWNDNTMTFTPDINLKYNTSYTCTVGTGAKDPAGNKLESPYEWGFTTVLSPTIVSVSPSNGATGVSVSSTISVTFTRAMNTASVEGAFSMSDNSNNPVTGTFGWDAMNTIMTFTPSTPLNEDTNYTCTVSKGATDEDGNPFTDAYPWSFTTGPAPTIISVYPSDKAVNISVNTTISVTFSEAMNQTSILDPSAISPSVSLTIEDISWNGSGNIATLTPSSPLVSNTTYTCTISTNAEDLAGNHLDPTPYTYPASYTWSFTTE